MEGPDQSGNSTAKVRRSSWVECAELCGNSIVHTNARSRWQAAASRCKDKIFDVASMSLPESVLSRLPNYNILRERRIHGAKWASVVEASLQLGKAIRQNCTSLITCKICVAPANCRITSKLCSIGLHDRKPVAA